MTLSASTTSSEAICEARNIGVVFNGRPALENVSLAINPNEVIAILGPSGCGKSTLLRMLVGLIQPTSGEVFAHGQTLSGIHSGISIVFQNFALYPWLTVRENIQVALNGLNLDPQTASQRVTKCIDMVGLDGSEEAYPKELSGGMKQRVGIARAWHAGRNCSAWMSLSAPWMSSRQRVCEAKSINFGQPMTPSRPRTQTANPSPTAGPD